MYFPRHKFRLYRRLKRRGENSYSTMPLEMMHNVSERRRQLLKSLKEIRRKFKETFSRHQLLLVIIFIFFRSLKKRKYAISGLSVLLLIVFFKFQTARICCWSVTCVNQIPSREREEGTSLLRMEKEMIPSPNDSSFVRAKKSLGAVGSWDLKKRYLIKLHSLIKELIN